MTVSQGRSCTRRAAWPASAVAVTAEQGRRDTAPGLARSPASRDVSAGGAAAEGHAWARAGGRVLELPTDPGGGIRVAQWPGAAGAAESVPTDAAVTRSTDSTTE